MPGMPRPARSIWVTRTYARRRHRSWMLSMTLASLGWGTWWVLLFARKLAGYRPESLALPGTISGTFAIVGLALALWSVRAQRSWMLFVAIAVLANGSLFFVPWLAGELLEDGPAVRGD